MNKIYPKRRFLLLLLIFIGVGCTNIEPTQETFKSPQNKEELKNMILGEWEEIIYFKKCLDTTYIRDTEPHIYYYSILLTKPEVGCDSLVATVSFGDSLIIMKNEKLIYIKNENGYEYDITKEMFFDTTSYKVLTKDIIQTINRYFADITGMTNGVVVNIVNDVSFYSQDSIVITKLVPKDLGIYSDTSLLRRK